VQPLAPYPEWTSQNLAISLPYCTDDSVNTAAFSNTSDYVAWPNGSFAFAGSVPSRRQKCIYLDEKWLVTNPLEPNSIFVPTRIRMYEETASSCVPGATKLTQNECKYPPAPVQSNYYIPDVEAYTLMIVHSISVPTISYAWSKDDMTGGQLVGVDGAPVDICNFYRKRNPNAPCPYNFDRPEANMTHYVSVGVRNVPDIIPVGALLEAAGVKSLDETSLLTDTYRYGGLTLVVQLCV
jgi:hypothetical protein